MKRKNLQFVLVLALMLSPFFNNGLHSQTAGTLTFTVNPTSHSGSYGSEHVVAIWIENSSAAFVKTKYRFASGHTLSSHLPVWKAKSSSNVVDATTGVTLTSYVPITIVWNGTNVSAANVPDGNYNVWVECTWDEGTSGTSTTSVQFAKGTSTVTLSPTSTTNFSGMSLSWVPAGIGIADIQINEKFSINPNPSTKESTVSYSLTTLSDITISVYDINGQLVKVLVDENQEAGDYNMPLSLNGGIKPGIYFVKMDTGKTQQTERVVITQ